MSETTYSVLTGLAYLTLIVIATWSSFRKGEKEGSVFMLHYLRANKFFNDTDYNKFMRHVRIEKKIEQIDEVSPKELKKNEKEKDISDNNK